MNVCYLLSGIILGIILFLMLDEWLKYLGLFGFLM